MRSSRRLFVPAVDERLALDLFAAAVALIARLSAGRPAGCVAEEILAVALLQEAHAWLEMEHDSHELDRATMETAAAELRGLFELFQDDDVLDMFDMREPSDAASSRFTFKARQMGIADQTVEHWFDPFGWTAPTGYLRGNTERPTGDGAERSRRAGEPLSRAPRWPRGEKASGARP